MTIRLAVELIFHMRQSTGTSVCIICFSRLWILLPFFSSYRAHDADDEGDVHMSLLLFLSFFGLFLIRQLLEIKFLYGMESCWVNQKNSKVTASERFML